MLALASTDYRARVIFAFLEATDKGGPSAAPFGVHEPGDCIAEWEMTKAWVNDAQWSPSGTQLAFIGQDGMLHVTNFGAAAGGAGGEPAVHSVKTSGLPGNAVLWLTEKALVVAGHNMNPDVFVAADGGEWKFAGAADVKVRIGGAVLSGASRRRALQFFSSPPHPLNASPFPHAGAALLQDTGASSARASSSAFGAAHAMFTSRVTKGAGAGDGGGETGPWTKHQGAITCLKALAVTAKGAVSRFSTSGSDGRLVIWDVATLKHLPAAALGL